MYFINPPMTPSAPINALRKPHTSGAVRSAQPSCPSSNTAAPAMMGAESKNEIRALWLRLSPSSNAAVIVMPERDTPGTSAKACAQPMSSRAFSPTAAVPWADARRSAAHSSTAKIIKHAAMTSGWRKVVSAQPFRHRPATAAGSVANAKPHRVRPCGLRGRVSPLCSSSHQSLAKYSSTASKVARCSSTSKATP